MFRNVKSAKKWYVRVIPVLVKAVRDTSAQKIFIHVMFVEKRFARSVPHNVMIAETFFAKNILKKCSHAPNVEKCIVHYATQDREYVRHVKKEVAR
jgi:hypothetical protein